jgi:hypothetical protein
MPSTNARRLYELSEEIRQSIRRITDDNPSISYIELESLYKTMITSLDKYFEKPQQPKRVVRI